MSLAIIGAGPAGLTAAKAALECRLKVTVFEKASTIGGLWKPGEGSTWKNMRTNLSRHTCMFSDFPWKKGIQDFPNQKEVYNYLSDYTKHFKITPCLQLNSEVQKVTQTNGKWAVEWLQKDQKNKKEFDFIIVATGVFSKAYIPPIEGLKPFSVSALHSKDYKTPEVYKNKTVAVIGNAFSGAEIAAELSLVAKHVLNIVHKNIWILPRYIDKKPLDLIFYSRLKHARNLKLTHEEVNIRKYNWFKNITKQDQICPVDALPSNPQFTTISDTYLEKLQNNAITLKKAVIQKIEENKILFEDGSFEPIDALIFCTGYKTKLSFLDSEILKSLEYKKDDQQLPILLHETVLHPQLPGMAFVGMHRGPFFGGMELQARWATLLFSQKLPMPTIEEMQKGIEEARKVRDSLLKSQFPYDYVDLLDRLAKKIDVLPNFTEMQQQDPTLHKTLWEGPLIPPHYRLTGIHSNSKLALELIHSLNLSL